MASTKVLCPSLPDLLRKTILTFCEGSVMFRSSLEVIGSLHIRSDNEKVTTFMLDEKVVRAPETVQETAAEKVGDTKRSEMENGTGRKARKISKPIKKIKYPEIYISSEVESETESVIVENLSMNQNHQNQFVQPPAIQGNTEPKASSSSSLQVDAMESTGSMSSDDAYQGRNMEQRRLSGTSTEEVTSTAGPQVTSEPVQNEPHQQQAYWLTNGQYQALPTTDMSVAANEGVPTDEGNRFTPSSQEQGASLFHQAATLQVKSEMLAPPELHPPQLAVVSTAMADITTMQGTLHQMAGDLQQTITESQPAQLLSGQAATLPKPFLLSPNQGGIEWAQMHPLLAAHGLAPNMMLPFTNPQLPQLPQVSMSLPVADVPPPPTTPTREIKVEQMPHSPDNRYGGKMCGECGKVLKSDRMLALHMNAAHTHKETFPCKVCGRVFYAASSLHSHKKRLHSTKEEKHPCPKCNKLFAFNSELSRHMQLMHGHSSLSQVSRSVDTVSTSSNGQRHMCMVCGKVLRSKECLILHINAKHTQKQRYPCKVCGKVFYAPSSRFCHMKRSHTSLEQKFRCHHCGKLFVFNYLLRNHLQIVHGDFSGVLNLSPSLSGGNNQGSTNEYPTAEEESPQSDMAATEPGLQQTQNGDSEAPNGVTSVESPNEPEQSGQSPT